MLNPKDVEASRCDAHFPLDGNLTDVTGNGYDGLIIGDASAKPEFDAGRFGQALRITNGKAMRAFLDLHHDGCPQFTITAWFRLRSVDSPAPQYLLSTGARGGIPAISIEDGTLTVHGKGNGISQRGVISDGGTWFFVAATFDYTDKRYSLIWQDREISGTLRNKPYDSEDALWIGTRSDELKDSAIDLMIDDIRVYGRVLELGEIQAISADGGQPSS